MGESGEYRTGPLSRRRTTQNKAVRSSKSFSDPYSDWRKNGRAEARRGGEVGRIGASWRAGEPRADGPPFFVGSNMKSLSYRELSTVLIASAYYQRSLVSTCFFIFRVFDDSRCSHLFFSTAAIGLHFPSSSLGNRQFKTDLGKRRRQGEGGRNGINGCSVDRSTACFKKYGNRQFIFNNIRGEIVLSFFKKNNCLQDFLKKKLVNGDFSDSGEIGNAPRSDRSPHFPQIN